MTQAQLEAMAVEYTEAILKIGSDAEDMFTHTALIAVAMAVAGIMVTFIRNGAGELIAEVLGGINQQVGRELMQYPGMPAVDAGTGPVTVH